jgi:Zn-dependent protease with chaperone function
VGFLARWGWLSVAILTLPVLLVVFSRPPATDHPLPPGPFNQAAQPILARAGVPGTPIVVRPGKNECAWGTVAGLGPSQRIVISQGTLTYPTDQALFTIAHESGHVRRGDPLLGVVVGWIWIVLALACAQGAAVWATRRWGFAGLLAAPLGFAFAYALGLPTFDLIQRNVERRADRFGVETTGDGAAAAAMIERSDACLGVHDSSGLKATLLLNHPSHSERVAMLRAASAR